MEFRLQQEQFDSMGQWFAWRVGLDLAGQCEPLTQGQPENRHAEPLPGGPQLRQFLQNMLSDLYAGPNAYGVPDIPYEPDLPGDKQREDRLREARLKVRRVIENGLLDFLYQVGRSGEPDGQGLKLSRADYDRLVGEKKKKCKTTAFLKPLEGLGLETEAGDEWVVLTNPGYPGMMQALTAFARACAGIKDLDFYFFRRCDFGIFAQKRLPAFEDALHTAPEALTGEICRMDAYLRALKFKREIFVASADGGYRFRYQKKNDAIVYWCRIRSWTSLAFSHNLRWDLTGLSPALFARLDASAPGLAERVFAGIKTCEHCYDPCMARVIVRYRDMTKEGCKEAGWDAIGESPADFENLRTVVCLLDELVTEKRG